MGAGAAAPLGIRDFHPFTKGAGKAGLRLHSATTQAIAEDYAIRRKAGLEGEAEVADVAVGVDFNVDRLAVTETDPSGNLLQTLVAAATLRSSAGATVSPAKTICMCRFMHLQTNGVI